PGIPAAFAESPLLASATGWTPTAGASNARGAARQDAGNAHRAEADADGVPEAAHGLLSVRRRLRRGAVSVLQGRGAGRESGHGLLAGATPGINATSGQDLYHALGHPFPLPGLRPAGAAESQWHPLAPGPHPAGEGTGAQRQATATVRVYADPGTRLG